MRHRCIHTIYITTAIKMVIFVHTSIGHPSLPVSLPRIPHTFRTRFHTRCGAGNIRLRLRGRRRPACPRSCPSSTACTAAATKRRDVQPRDLVLRRRWRNREGRGWRTPPEGAAIATRRSSLTARADAAIGQPLLLCGELGVRVAADASPRTPATGTGSACPSWPWINVPQPFPQRKEANLQACPVSIAPSASQTTCRPSHPWAEERATPTRKSTQK